MQDSVTTALCAISDEYRTGWQYASLRIQFACFFMTQAKLAHQRKLDSQPLLTFVASCKTFSDTFIHFLW